MNPGLLDALFLHGTWSFCVQRAEYIVAIKACFGTPPSPAAAAAGRGAATGMGVGPLADLVAMHVVRSWFELERLAAAKVGTCFLVPPPFGEGARPKSSRCGVSRVRPGVGGGDGGARAARARGPRGAAHRALHGNLPPPHELIFLPGHLFVFLSTLSPTFDPPFWFF